MNIKKILWENKEGITLGAVVGYVMGRWFLPDIVDFSMVMQTEGIIDVVAGAGKSAMELAKTKIIWGSTFIGGLVGGYLDSLLPEGFLRKRRWS